VGGQPDEHAVELGPAACARVTAGNRASRAAAVACAPGLDLPAGDGASCQTRQAGRSRRHVGDQAGCRHPVRPPVAGRPEGVPGDRQKCCLAR
jgi:hypothetical protein